MKTQVFNVLIIFAVISFFSLSSHATDSGYEGLLLSPAKKINSYSLMDHTGKPIDFPESNGHMKFVFFGYANCPDVCPMTLIKVKKLIQALGEEANDLDFYFVSIDPQRDNKDQLKKYVANYGTRITGITGEPHPLKELENEFGILTRKFQGKSAFAYTLEHSVFIYLLDQQGYLRIMYPASTSISAIVNDIEKGTGHKKLIDGNIKPRFPIYIYIPTVCFIFIEIIIVEC